MSGGFSLVHWLILLVVVVVVFGTSKLKNAGKDLGSAVKGFKDAVKEDESQVDAVTHNAEHRDVPSEQVAKTVRPDDQQS